MDAVTLTFPGHFFQTALSIQSIKRWYQPRKHYIILDDLEKGPWESYIQDAQEFYGSDYIFISTSTVPRMDQTLSGWWRQQLIKLTLDTLLPEENWLVVDGDVIFDSYCEYKDVVPITKQISNFDGKIEIFTQNYIKNLLGCEKATIYHNGRPYMTNPVPYRFLTSELLKQLRNHVEHRFGKDFVDCHIDWFHDQTIVGMHDDVSKWNMSEWELIEIFRREILKEYFPELMIGSGYPLDIDLSTIDPSLCIFRHGYRRDAQLDRDFFQTQGLEIPIRLWNQSRQWLENREPWRA